MFKKTQPYFWFALIGHLLLLLSLVTILRNEVIYKPKTDENRYLPAYMYHPPTQPTQATQPSTPQQVIQRSQPKRFPPLKKVPISFLGIEKPADQQKMQQMQQQAKVFQIPRPSSVSYNAPNQALTMKSDETIDEPLLRLLTKATAERLIYPQIAVALRQTGLVKLRFYIYPSGQITQISLLKSSGFDPLDNAALDAVRAMSPVRNVNVYLKKPKFITAYIHFSE